MNKRFRLCGIALLPQIQLLTSMLLAVSQVHVHATNVSGWVAVHWNLWYQVRYGEAPCDDEANGYADAMLNAVELGADASQNFIKFGFSESLSVSPACDIDELYEGDTIQNNDV